MNYFLDVALCIYCIPGCDTTRQWADSSKKADRERVPGKSETWRCHHGKDAITVDYGQSCKVQQEGDRQSEKEGNWTGEWMSWWSQTLTSNHIFVDEGNWNVYGTVLSTADTMQFCSQHMEKITTFQLILKSMKNTKSISTLVSLFSKQWLQSTTQIL